MDASTGTEEEPTEDSRQLPKNYDALAPRLPESGCDLFEIFGATAEIEIVIGFGRGMFLERRTAANPDAWLLGIEIKSKWAYKVSERCKRRGLDRVRAYGGDVRQVLPNLGPDACLARAFLHFPDPWWKKRHAKRMVMGQLVLDELARLLRPGGEFFVQTDVEDRAEGYRRQLQEHPRFELEGQGYLQGNPYDAVSNREKRAIEDGLPVYRLLALRV
ncbi:MAG: tRNA (guanine-N7)-methyltransferase [Myxococcales bacterium]|nr:tRNA (guanine-N7)-methyltransferase [Myxococcales bacterium]